MLVYSAANLTAASLNSRDFENCYELPFGSVTGQSFGTIAYSNNYGRDDKHDGYQYIDVPGKKKPVFTGVKWQCVEYARRWLIENRLVTFDSIDNAYNIWDLPNFTDVCTKERVPVKHYYNKTSKVAPAVGDLLIYSPEEVHTGHVAVIVGVYDDSITIAEQNHCDCSWEKHEYARRLRLKQDAEGRFQIVDKAVIGWIHIKD
jgi:glutathionylspermidine amidase/synthetase